MKRLIFLLLPLIFFSQESTYNFQATYNLKYKLDSSSVYPRKEIFYLFFNNKESYFVSDKILKSDSISSNKTNDPSSQIMSLAGNMTYFGEKIFNRKDDIIVNFKNNNYTVFYVENKNAHWEITNQVKTINNIKCNIAKAKIYGRNWEACFDENYPFPYGPYKFYGLPGIIIELKDDQDTYNYTLTSINRKNIPINQTINKPILITKEKYFEIINELKYGGTLFNQLKFEDQSQINIIKLNREKRRKAENNFPIDKDMRYIFK